MQSNAEGETGQNCCLADDSASWKYSGNQEMLREMSICPQLGIAITVDSKSVPAHGLMTQYSH